MDMCIDMLGALRVSLACFEGSILAAIVVSTFTSIYDRRHDRRYARYSPHLVRFVASAVAPCQHRRRPDQYTLHVQCRVIGLAGIDGVVSNGALGQRSPDAMAVPVSVEPAGPSQVAMPASLCSYGLYARLA